MNRKDTFNRLRADVISDIEQLRIKVETVAAAGLSLGYDFCEISMLQNASSILQWCSKVLFLCSEAPSLEVTVRNHLLGFCIGMGIYVI